MKELKFDETPNLEVVSDTLGISYTAVKHMYEFSALNETEVLNDLKNGLLFEWLTFVNLFTDSYVNDFEEAIITLFIDSLNEFITIDLSNNELLKMLKDKCYTGTMYIINLDIFNNEESRIPMRLNITQYLNFLETYIK
jgi:hypothetical protein